jgi:radical SAM superfamily enzyme YgiQ (UPF0313 family)
MKIAFVSGNQEKLPDAVIPLGLLQVMASTPAHHEKLLIDLCFEPDPAQALRAQIERFGPDLVALGMRNIQTNEYSGINDNVAYYGELISHTKQATGAPIVIGGGGFSVMPRELMERLRPDFGIAGEGELAFAGLVEELEQQAPERLADLANLHRFEHGKLVSNPAPAGFLDMKGLPLPDRRLIDPRYYEGYGIDSVQTKRGCPLRCDYCTYPLIEGRVARVRDPAAVVDEMFLVLEQQPSTRHLFIVDSVFNLPRAHAKKVCREMIARAWKLPWTCYANPLGFDRELAELAREAGCAGMEIGSDSGCDEILERLRKGFTTDQIRSLHQLCKSAGVPDCHTFILGTRGETLEHVRRTLDFIVELDPFSAIIMIWIDDYEALDPELRKQRIELRSQIEELLMKRRRDFPQWVIPTLGVNFSEALFRLLRRNGLHGPLWQHIRAGH